jgi:hypothetical protein
VTIPMNSHMTHTIRRSARRPSSDGYCTPYRIAMQWPVSVSEQTLQGGTGDVVHNEATI